MDRGWLAEELESGRSIEAIAHEVGRHPSTVAYWVRRHGLSSLNVERHAARGGIDRATLERLVDEGLSIRQIAARADRGYGTVRHWLREHGLSTRRAGASRQVPRDAGEVIRRECPVHGTADFVRRGDGSGWRCLRCRAEAVTKRRRLVKETLVCEAGGACVLCGYGRFAGALQFHHVDPRGKRFSLSALGVARSLERARAEAGKCVLLCANCHAEVEAGLAAIPSPGKVASEIARADHSGVAQLADASDC
jgi:transposase